MTNQGHDPRYNPVFQRGFRGESSFANEDLDPPTRSVAVSPFEPDDRSDTLTALSEGARAAATFRHWTWGITLLGFALIFGAFALELRLTEYQNLGWGTQPDGAMAVVGADMSMLTLRLIQFLGTLTTPMASIGLLALVGNVFRVAQRHLDQTRPN